jgi:hypothetical protein
MGQDKQLKKKEGILPIYIKRMNALINDDLFRICAVHLILQAPRDIKSRNFLFFNSVLLHYLCYKTLFRGSVRNNYESFWFCSINI